MKRSKFFFKQSFFEAAGLISDSASRAEFIMAVTAYGINGEIYQGDNEIIRVAMTLIMAQIDAENRRYLIDENQQQAVKSANHDLSHSDSESRVAILRDRNENNARAETTHREFRRWIRINAPNVYQRLCRKISNRELIELTSRYDKAQLQRKILKLEHNGKILNLLESLTLALSEIEERSAA